MDFNQGPVGRIPFVISREYLEEIENLSKQGVSLVKADWDDRETSWDFAKHPFIAYKCDTIEESYKKWAEICNDRYNKLKEYEERINEIFIKFYGFENELTPEVEDLSISFADKERDIRSFISYVVGCIFGRYSIDCDGIYFAGGKWHENVNVNSIVNTNNCILITDEEYFTDDIVNRFVEFVKVVYGEETLEENLDFIAQALGNKGNTSREVIRNYFLKEFYTDHLKVYQKRPIYWLFDSGKRNGFKALIYMHRYNADTIGNLRVDYLHCMERIYESEINRTFGIIQN